jgi:microcystin-dependent protein
MNAQQSTSSAQAITAIDSSGNLSALSFPSGFILIWYPPDNTLTTLALIQKIIPSGWAICDGTNGTPDLRGRFVLMAQDTIPTINVPTGSSVHAIGQIGGEEKHVLTIDEMPAHSHPYERATRNGDDSSGNRSDWNISRTELARTQNEGGNQPHNNMPPYYTLVYVMKL